MLAQLISAVTKEAGIDHIASILSQSLMLVKLLDPSFMKDQDSRNVAIDSIIEVLQKLKT